MTLHDLKRMNSVSIYRAILNGKTSIAAISARTGICNLTVGELANELVARNILEMTKPRRNIRGKRIHYFNASNKHFCVLIDMQSTYFVTIGITTNGSVVERFDYSLNYEGYSKQEVFDKFIISRLKQSENYKFCLGIYLIGDINNEINVDNDIIKTTKEVLLVNSMADETKLTLFEINGKCIMSLYSHIHFPTVGKKALVEAISFDEICTLQGDLNLETLNALERITQLKMLSFI